MHYIYGIMTIEPDLPTHGLNLGYTLLPMGRLDASNSYTTMVFKIPHLPASTHTMTPTFCKDDLTTHYSSGNQYHLTGKQRSILAGTASQYTRLCASYDALQDSFDALSSVIHQETTDLQQDIDLLSPIPRDQPEPRPKRQIGDSIRTFFGIASLSTQRQLIDRVQDMQQHQDFMTDKLNNMTLITEIQTDMLDGLLNASAKHTEVLNTHTRRLTHIFTEQQRITFQNAVDHGLTMRLHALTKQLVLTGILQLSVLHHLKTLNTQRIIAVNTLLTNRLSPLLVPPNEMEQALERVQTQLYINYPAYTIVHTDVSYYYARPHIVAWTSHTDIYVALRVPLTSAQETYKLFEVITFPLASASDTISTLISDAADIIGYNSDQHRLVFMTWDDYTRYCIRAEYTRCTRHIPQYAHNPDQLCESALYDKNALAIAKTCNIKAVANDYKNQKITLINTGKQSILILATSAVDAYIQCRHDRTHIMVGPVTELTLSCDCSLNSEIFRVPPLLTDKCAHMKGNYEITQYNQSNWILKSMYYNVTDEEQLSRLPGPQLSESMGSMLDNAQLDANSMVNLRKLIALTKEKLTAPPRPPIWSKQSHAALSTSIITLWRYVFPILAVLASIVVTIVCLICRTNILARGLALLSTVPPAQAYSLTVTTSLWVEHVILAIIIVIAASMCLRKLYKYISRRIKWSFIPLLDSRLLPRLTKVYLVAFTAHQTEYILVEKVTQALEHLSIPRRVDDVRLSLIKHCMTATLQIEWNELTVEDKCADVTWQLPSVVPISLLQYYRLNRIIGNSHNCRLLTGSDNIYQSHQLVREEKKLKIIRHILPGTGAYRRDSV
jgi:hypothetical protein